MFITNNKLSNNLQIQVVKFFFKSQNKKVTQEQLKCYFGSISSNECFKTNTFQIQVVSSKSIDLVLNVCVPFFFSTFKGMNQNKFAMGLSKSGAGSTGLGVGPAVSSDFLSPPSAHSSSSSSRHLAAFFSSGEQLTSPDKRKSCSSDSLSHQQQPPLPAHQHQQHSSTPASARNSVFRFVIHTRYFDDS